MHQVVVRLADDDRVVAGSFEVADAAREHAQALVRTLQAGDGWPLVADRYVRPGAVVSVDLVEVDEQKWAGSVARTTWATERARREAEESAG